MKFLKYTAIFLALAIATSCILTIVTVPFGLHKLRDYLLEYEDLAAVTTKSEIPILEPTQQEASPTPAERHRVVIFQATDQPEFTKLVKAAGAEGIEITLVTNREDFFSALYAPDVALVIYMADSWNDQNDIRQIISSVNKGNRVLFIYNHYWGAMSPVFEELFEVSITKEDVINAGGVVSINDTLPDFLSDQAVFAEGTAWVGGAAYLETDIENGEKIYIKSESSGEDRLVFFSFPDKSVTFLLAVRANDLGSSSLSYVFFDDTSIEHGDNEKAALLFLNYLLE